MERIKQHLDKQPVAVDAAIALGLFLFTLRGLAQNHQGDLPSWLIQVGLCAPVALRRRAPMLAFCIVVAAAFAQWVDDWHSLVDVSLLFILYSLAARSSLRRALMATAVMQGGAFIAVIRWVPPNSAVPAFMLVSGTVGAALIAGINTRTRHAYLETLENRAARLERERAQLNRLSAAAERSRIAREMHDVVAHSLSVMIALADGAAFSSQSSPENAANAMRQVSATGRQAVAEMRRMLGVLRDDKESALLAPQPGLSRIDDLLDQVRNAGIHTKLTIVGQPPDFGAGLELTIYRIIQEALTNVIKHAPTARVVDVQLSFQPDAIELEITNDGAICRLPEQIEGHGTVGMTERVELYRGSLVAEPLPTGGWQVKARLNVEMADAG